MQELAYEKKQRYVADYTELVHWVNHRSVEQSMERNAIADSITYFKIDGIISDRTGETMKRFVSSAYALQVPLVSVYRIKNHRIEVMLGCERDKVDMLRELASRVLGCRCSLQNEHSENMFDHRNYLYESAILGDAAYKEERQQNVMDIVMSEGFSDECCIVTVASPLSRETSIRFSDYFDDLSTELNSMTSRQITSRDDKDSVSYTEENGFLKRFQEFAGKFQKKYEVGMTEGLFLTSVKIFSNDKSINDLVAGAIISQSEEVEYPEVLQHIYMPNCVFDDELYTTMKSFSINGKTLSLPMTGNFHTSSELAYFIDLPKCDTLGFYKRAIPQFDVERDANEGILIGSTLKAGKEASEYYLPMSELNRNVLVSGLVGSGKTNSIEHLLIELNREGIPFLVIEPVKTEYYEMADRINDLKVISVGSDKNGLRLNPFQPVSDRVSLQKHVDSLYSAIMAAFEWVPPMPQIVEKVIYRVYSDNGFDVANNIRNANENYPTIEQAYWTIRTVVKEEKFDARMESDLIGCIGARFNSLRVGNKGRTLNVRKSMSMEKLFDSNCVFELEEIQDEEVRSFIMGLILANLREYCMLRETSHLAVRHCTVIEEAHTLLRKIDSSSSAAQAKGVKVFSEMIKTLRAKGESFVIVDQVPTELADDVLKNTNLKIAHRIVAADDKSALGKTMNCTEEQETYMTVLNRGEALVFSEGDYRPKHVKVPYAGVKVLRSREEILKDSCFEDVVGQSLYDVSPVCLYCELCDCSSLDEMLTNGCIDKIDEWQEKLSECEGEEDFENLIMDIIVELKRAEKYEYSKCVVSKLIHDMDISIQEKHELCNIYRKIKE